MKLWDAPKLGLGPEPREALSAIGLGQSALSSTVDFVRGLVGAEAPAEPATREPVETAATGETPQQSGRIDEFLGGVDIVPVRSSRIVEVRYSSTDPVFAAEAANASRPISSRAWNTASVRRRTLLIPRHAIGGAAQGG